jgi:hypothetical protein
MGEQLKKSPVTATLDTAAAALLQDGMLTRLDDKLDELEATNRLSRPQLQEEQWVRPPDADGRRRGVPLKDAVRDLTCQWSEGFLSLASEGDSACMFIVAQMMLAPRGYGSMPSNRSGGLHWLMRSVDAGDLEARAYARRAFRDELMRHLVLRDLSPPDAAALVQDEEALRAAMERVAVREKEVELEEKRLAAEREAEFGE